MLYSTSDDSPLQQYKALQRVKHEEEQRNRLRQERLDYSLGLLEQLKELTRAMRFSLGPHAPPPAELEEHCNKVTCQLAETLAAYREADPLEQIDQVDEQATIGHYRQQGDDPQEIRMLFAYAKQMIEAAVSDRQQLAEMVRHSVEEPGLLRAWNWVYILLDGLFGQQMLVWKQRPSTPSSPATGPVAERGQSDNWARQRGRGRKPDPQANKQKLGDWALATEHDGKWHLFCRFGDAWRHQGRAKGIARGRQEELLRGFAACGGILSDDEAVKLVRQTTSALDRKKIKRRLKPEISRLRQTIRKNLDISDPKVDPLPRDRHARAWQAAIQIGYASQNDDRCLEFKLREELSDVEALDF